MYKSYTKKLKTVISFSRTRSENYKEWVCTSVASPTVGANYVNNGEACG